MKRMRKFFKRMHKFLHRWRFIVIPVFAFFSQAIPDLDEIPMIWELLTTPAVQESVVVAHDGEVIKDQN